MLNITAPVAVAVLSMALNPFAVPALAASASPTPVEFTNFAPLNSNAVSDAGNDLAASVATDSAGTWIVVWQSNSTADGKVGSDYDIFLTRSTDDGKHWSKPTAVNSNAGDDVYDDTRPHIATDAKGRWVVIWTSNNPMGERLGLDPDLLVAYSKDAGASWSAPEPLYKAGADDDLVETGVSIATDGRGTWGAAFAAGSITDSEALRRNLYVTRRTKGAVGWTDPVQVNPTINTERRTDNTGPTLAITPDGTWVVVWRNFTADIADVYESRSNDDGKTWTGMQTLYPLAGKSHTNSGPRLAHAGKEWMCTWVSADFDARRLGADQDLVFVHSADAGKTWSPPKELNADAATDTRHSRDELARVAGGAAAGWLTVWARQDDQKTHGRDVDLRASYSADGKTWSEPFFVNSDATTDRDHDLGPVVTADGKGTWLVVWTRAALNGGPTGKDRDLFFSVGRRRQSESNGSGTHAATPSP